MDAIRSKSFIRVIASWFWTGILLLALIPVTLFSVIVCLVIPKRAYGRRIWRKK